MCYFRYVIQTGRTLSAHLNKVYSLLEHTSVSRHSQCTFLSSSKITEVLRIKRTSSRIKKKQEVMKIRKNVNSNILERIII